MTRTPDAINVAGPDTHCLIVAVPYNGPADVSSNLPRSTAAAILREIADGLDDAEQQPCGYRAVTGKPCPVHDRAASPSAALYDAGRQAAEGAARGMRKAQRPRGLDDLLAHLAGRTADGHPADGEQPRQHPNPFALDPEPNEEQPAGTPERVRCAHDYWLMQDSCPGCDAEQETPHAADPVTLRPAWARRDMRRCRRCGLVPSHAIHPAKRTT
jgi:hypothetical protein